MSTTTCRCDHTAAAHQHHRAGTECALCEPGACPRFRRPRRWLRFIGGAR